MSRYLDLLVTVLTDSHRDYEYKSIAKVGKYHLCKKEPVNNYARLMGKDWPEEAFTMIGRLRLNNIRELYETVYSDGIEGDLCECGVWRGGATIFMAALLEEFDDTNRQVWVCDSFQGLPLPTWLEDEGDDHYTHEVLSVGQSQVMENFNKLGLGGNVSYLKGWFKDTLPTAPIEKLSILRVDCDMYQSTWEVLENLYPKVSEGGFVIVDDYVCIEQCRKAVTDFRLAYDIASPIHIIDDAGIYWRK